MCGIIGYIGNKNSIPIIIEGLKNLEYRGYDSAGLAIISGDQFTLKRCQGKVSDLENMILKKDSSVIGIGHTRWATHGIPSEENAHPHLDCKAKIVVAHNGIVENYVSLKEMLIAEGHEFKSETDTEVIAHLIEKYYKNDIYNAVRSAIKNIQGSYALAVLHVDHKDEIIVAKNQSPLILGLGEDENYIASDIPAILSYTKKIIYLEDDEIAIVKKNEIIVKNKKDIILKKKITLVTWSYDMAQKSGYDNFMLKEIFEQPRAIEETINGRISTDTGKVYLKEIGLTDEDIRSIERIVIISCGTSWHAGLIGRIYIEKLTRIPVSVEYASEFRYTEPILNKRVLTIGISQSGETADTLAGMKEAKRRGSKVIAICNVVGSSISRISNGIIYTHAGPEIGVASTKAFTSQLAILYLFAIYMARIRFSMLISDATKMIEDIRQLQDKLLKTLELSDKVKKLANKFYKAKNFIYLGRGLGYAAALEGALKLKEISYIHAEGYHAGEMKHGPIALIDKNMPVVVLALKGRRYNKIINNIEEVKARGGVVIAIATEGDETIKNIVDYVIYIPEVQEFLSSILAVIPLQFLAYYIAVKRGCNVDQPRNLAKSVTVE